MITDGSQMMGSPKHDGSHYESASVCYKPNTAGIQPRGWRPVIANGTELNTNEENSGQNCDWSSFYMSDHEDGESFYADSDFGDGIINNGSLLMPRPAPKPEQVTRIYHSQDHVQ